LITALRAPAIKQLAGAGGPLQPSLFDDRDMAEITSPDYPGERLVVCKNPLLAEERARKRAELLAGTENDLARIAARVQRARRPLRGAAAIGQAAGAVLGRRHMAKHFQISIGDERRCMRVGCRRATSRRCLPTGWPQSVEPHRGERDYRAPVGGIRELRQS
jgi:hypothetical protein